MGKVSDRVIAIDYFRGICILMILLNHGSTFTTPFDLLSGGSRLWTSAAEMFFLLSGLTFGIVRKKYVKTNFSYVVRKSYRRAALLYLIYIGTVLGSLILLEIFKAAHVKTNMPGALPQGTNPLHLLFSILALSYTAGWANFLMYYSIYLLAAPYLLRALAGSRRVVAPMLVGSAVIYTVGSLQLLPLGSYQAFLIWQLYFVIGLVLSEARVSALGRFYKLSDRKRKILSGAVMSAAVLVLAFSILVEFHLQRFISQLVSDGYLPAKALAAYNYLLNHKAVIDHWTINNRTGLLRPPVTLISLGAAYLVYQKYKAPLLRYTGEFVNLMGRNTLIIFVAQAFTIPILAALPVPHDIIGNFLMSCLLIVLMWSLVQAKSLSRLVVARAGQYRAGLEDLTPRAEAEEEPD